MIILKWVGQTNIKLGEGGGSETREKKVLIVLKTVIVVRLHIYPS